MTFTPKIWENAPSTATPITAQALEDLEARLAAYTDLITVPGFAAVTKVEGYGNSILYGTGAASPATDSALAQVAAKFNIGSAVQKAIPGAQIQVGAAGFGGWGDAFLYATRAPGTAQAQLALIVDGMNDLGASNNPGVNGGFEHALRAVLSRLSTPVGKFFNDTDASITYGTGWTSYAAGDDTYGRQPVHFTDTNARTIDIAVPSSAAGSVMSVMFLAQAGSAAVYTVSVDSVEVGILDTTGVSPGITVPCVLRIPLRVAGAHSVHVAKAAGGAGFPVFMGWQLEEAPLPRLLVANQYKPADYSAYASGWAHVPTDADVDALNVRIAAVVGEFPNATLVDVTALDKRGDLMATVDRLHPNPTGHKLIGDAFIGAARGNDTRSTVAEASASLLSSARDLSSQRAQSVIGFGNSLMSAFGHLESPSARGGDRWLSKLATFLGADYDQNYGIPSGVLNQSDIKGTQSMALVQASARMGSTLDLLDDRAWAQVIPVQEVFNAINVFGADTNFLVTFEASLRALIDLWRSSFWLPVTDVGFTYGAGWTANAANPANIPVPYRRSNYTPGTITRTTPSGWIGGKLHFYFMIGAGGAAAQNTQARVKAALDGGTSNTVLDAGNGSVLGYAVGSNMSIMRGSVAVPSGAHSVVLTIDQINTGGNGVFFVGASGETASDVPLILLLGQPALPTMPYMAGPFTTARRNTTMAKMKEIASSYLDEKVRYVNLDAMNGYGGYFEDGLHFNVLGHAVVTDLVVAEILNSPVIPQGRAFGLREVGAKGAVVPTRPDFAAPAGSRAPDTYGIMWESTTIQPQGSWIPAGGVSFPVDTSVATTTALIDTAVFGPSIQGITPTPRDGVRAHDPTAKLDLIRQAGKWQKTAALTQIT